jgi:hypothetical protein
MANNTATWQALIHIGFTQAAAQAIVDEQGINSLGIKSHICMYEQLLTLLLKYEEMK